MKVFLVLQFLLLLFDNSEESTLPHKRTIRGLDTTLQTNFNGSYLRKNPCTNAEIETSSYVASHKFHHHINEDSWSDYSNKCSAIISSFLEGIGNLIRFNSKQNGTFNFHVNTSISQKQDEKCVGGKHCSPLPTIIIEAESFQLPPPCKSAQKQDDKTGPVTKTRATPIPVKQKIFDEENYSTAPYYPTLSPIEEERRTYAPNKGVDGESKLIKDGPPNRKFSPIPGFPKSRAEGGARGTTPSSQGFYDDYAQNPQDSEIYSDFPLTPENEGDFTAPITTPPEDEFTTYPEEKADYEFSPREEDQSLESDYVTSPVTPVPWQDSTDESSFTTPRTQNFPNYPPLTASGLETTPRPTFVNDEKLINDQYQPSTAKEKPIPDDLDEEMPVFQTKKSSLYTQPPFAKSSPTPNFESKSKPVGRPFGYQQTLPEDKEEEPKPDYMAPDDYDDEFPPSEGFLPVEPFPGREAQSDESRFASEMDDFPLQEETQSFGGNDEMNVNTTPYPRFSKPEEFPEVTDSKKFRNPMLSGITPSYGYPTYPSEPKTSSYPYETTQFKEYDETPMKTPSAPVNRYTNKPKTSPSPPQATGLDEYDEKNMREDDFYTNAEQTATAPASAYPDYEPEDLSKPTTPIADYSDQLFTTPSPSKRASTDLQTDAEVPEDTETSDDYYGSSTTDSLGSLREDDKPFPSTPVPKRPFFIRQPTPEPIRNSGRQPPLTDVKPLRNRYPNPSLSPATSLYDEPEILPEMSSETENQSPDFETPAESNFDDEEPMNYNPNFRPEFDDDQSGIRGSSTTASYDQPEISPEMSPEMENQSPDFGIPTESTPDFDAEAPTKYNPNIRREPGIRGIPRSRYFPTTPSEEYLTTPPPSQIPPPPISSEAQKSYNNRPKNFRPEPQPPLVDETPFYDQRSDPQPFSDDYGTTLSQDSPLQSSVAYPEQQSFSEVEPERNFDSSQEMSEPTSGYPVTPDDPQVSSFSKSEARSFSEVVTPAPKENVPDSLTKFSTEGPDFEDNSPINPDEQSSSYPDVYSSTPSPQDLDGDLPEETPDDYYTPVYDEPRYFEKTTPKMSFEKPSVDEPSSSLTTFSPKPESFTTYDSQYSDEPPQLQDDANEDENPTSPEDEFFDMRNNAPLLNEETTPSYKPNPYAERVLPDGYKNVDPYLIPKQNSERFETPTTPLPALPTWTNRDSTAFNSDDKLSNASGEEDTLTETANEEDDYTSPFSPEPDVKSFSTAPPLQFAPTADYPSSQTQPPVDYFNEEASDRYLQQPPAPFNPTSVPEPQPKDTDDFDYSSTPPMYEDSTPAEEPLSDATAPEPQTSSYLPEENMPSYSTPESQPQPQPSYDYSDIPGDSTPSLASRTFENSKTNNQYPLNSFPSTRRQFTFTESPKPKFTSPKRPPSDYFVTTPTPLPTTNAASFASSISDLESEKLITDTNERSEENADAQEAYMFSDNVSPQPQPTTAVNYDEEIETAQYPTSPAPNPLPQTTMNYANQLSDDNQDGNLPEYSANQQPDDYSEPESATAIVGLTEVPDDIQTVEVNEQSGTGFQSSESNQNTEKTTEEVGTAVYPTQTTPQPNYQRGSYLPYNNKLRSQPVPQNPIPQEQESKMDSQQNPTEYFEETFTPPQSPRRRVQFGKNKGRDTPRVTQSYEISKSLAQQRRRQQPNYRKGSVNWMPQGSRPQVSKSQVPPGPYFYPNRNLKHNIPLQKPLRRFPRPQQDEHHFEDGFPSNVSYPDYAQRPEIDSQYPEQDYAEYDQAFPNLPPRQKFDYDEDFPQNSQKVGPKYQPVDRRGPYVNEPQGYYQERHTDRESSGFSPQKHSNPLFHSLESYMNLPLHEPHSTPKPNESFLEKSPDSHGWEFANPPLPRHQDTIKPESQLVSDLTDPSNNPDRTTNGRFNYMDRPVGEPFHEERMSPVSTPERL